MRSTVVVDANLILRYLLGDHPEHSAAAAELMERVRGGDAFAYVPEGVVVECVYVLLKVYRVPRDEVAGKLIGILSFRGIANEARDVLLAALRLFRDRNVDIVDGIVQATAAKRGWQPFSFDRDLKRLAGS